MESVHFTSPWLSYELFGGWVMRNLCRQLAKERWPTMRGITFSFILQDTEIISTRWRWLAIEEVHCLSISPVHPPLLNAVLQGAPFPSSCKESVIKNLLKPGKDTTLTGRFRAISSLNANYKVFASTINRRCLRALQLFPMILDAKEHQQGKKRSHCHLSFVLLGQFFPIRNHQLIRLREGLR